MQNYFNVLTAETFELAALKFRKGYRIILTVEI